MKVNPKNQHPDYQALDSEQAKISKSSESPKEDKLPLKKFLNFGGNNTSDEGEEINQKRFTLLDKKTLKRELSFEDSSPSEKKKKKFLDEEEGEFQLKPGRVLNFDDDVTHDKGDKASFEEDFKLEPADFSPVKKDKKLIKGDSLVESRKNKFLNFEDDETEDKNLIKSPFLEDFDSELAGFSKIGKQKKLVRQTFKAQSQSSKFLSFGEDDFKGKKSTKSFDEDDFQLNTVDFSQLDKKRDVTDKKSKQDLDFQQFLNFDDSKESTQEKIQSPSSSGDFKIHERKKTDLRPTFTPVDKRRKSLGMKSPECSAEILDNHLIFRGKQLRISDRLAGAQHSIYLFSPGEDFKISEESILKACQTYALKQPKVDLNSNQKFTIREDDLKLFSFFEKNKISSPKVFLRGDEVIDQNQPKNSGFWILEYIPQAIDEELLKNATSIDSLSKSYQDTLKFVRLFFEKASKKETTLSDLKPANLRLRDDGSFVVVDALILDKNDEFDTNLQLATDLRKWSLGNDVIYDFLVENFGEKEKEEIKKQKDPSFS